MQEPRKGVPAPNYTQVPNLIFELMAAMEGTELRVVLAIARRTFGYHKEKAKASISDLMKDTGLSRPSVISGVEAGAMRGLVQREPAPNDGRGGFLYWLNVQEDKDADQLNDLTSQIIEPVKSFSTTSKTILPVDAPQPVKSFNQPIRSKESTYVKEKEKESIEATASLVALPPQPQTSSSLNSTPAKARTEPKAEKQAMPLNHPVLLAVCEITGIDLTAHSTVQTDRYQVFAAAKPLAADGATPDTLREVESRMRQIWPWSDGRPIKPHELRQQYQPLLKQAPQAVKAQRAPVLTEGDLRLVRMAENRPASRKPAETQGVRHALTG